MRHRFSDAQRHALVHRSTRYLLLAGALAALLSGGCREAAEQPAAPKAGATTASTTRTAGPAAQETKGHTHDAASAPHAHGPADQEGIRLSAAARANLNLDVAEVATQTIEQVLNIPGVVKALPDRVAVVTPRLPARIEKVYVNVGDVVTQGAPLLDLRSTEVEKLQVEILRTVKSLSIVAQSYERTKELTTNTVLTELEQLQQELIKAHGTLQMAAAAVERTQQLSDKVLLTNLGLSPQAAVQKYLVLGKPSELFALEADYRQKQGEVESLKRQLQILGFSAAGIATILQRGVPDPILTLTAPISGAISARQATPGAMVEATEKLLELIDTSLVWIEGDVVEHLLTAVRPGQQARIRVAAYPEVVFTGTVRTMGRTVDPDKRTVHLWIEVPNPQGQLLPEMFATVTLITQAATDALAVPLQAILTEGAEQFVFVENGDTYVRQSVVLGLKDDRYVEIRDGLFPGDRIVVRGGYELNAVRTVAAQQAQGGDGHAGHTH